jgi:hypothetical protein
VVLSSERHREYLVGQFICPYEKLLVCRASQKADPIVPRNLFSLLYRSPATRFLGSDVINCYLPMDPCNDRAYCVYTGQFARIPQSVFSMMLVGQCVNLHDGFLIGSATVAGVQLIPRGIEA